MSEEGLKTVDQEEKSGAPEEKKALEKEKAPEAGGPVGPPEDAPERKDEVPPEAPPKPEEKKPEKPEPPKEVNLDANEGSAVHLAQLNLLNMNSGVKQIQLELAAAEGKVRHLREKLQWEGGKLNTERNAVLAILSKNGVPDGWRFARHEDGSYTFTPPAPALPPGPPKPPVG